MKSTQKNPKNPKKSIGARILSFFKRSPSHDYSSTVSSSTVSSIRNARSFDPAALRAQIPVPSFGEGRPLAPEVIAEFFEVNSLDGWRTDLWHWYSSVVTENVCWSADRPPFAASHLLHNYVCLLALLQLYQDRKPQIDPYSEKMDRPSIRLPEPVVPWEVVDSRGSRVEIRHVAKAETEDLQATLEQLLQQYAPSEWDRMLFDWLTYGLALQSMPPALGLAATPAFYYSLVKMLEVSYLLAFCSKKQVGR